VGSNSAPSHTTSADNEFINSNGSSIQHVYLEDRHRSLSPPKLAADELTSGPGTSSNPVIEMPSPAICDNGGISDISAWATSKEDSCIHISSHSEGNEITENIQHSNKDSAVSYSIYLCFSSKVPDVRSNQIQSTDPYRICYDKFLHSYPVHITLNTAYFLHLVYLPFRYIGYVYFWLCLLIHSPVINFWLMFDF
jgi:hypothetical protein